MTHLAFLALQALLAVAAIACSFLGLTRRLERAVEFYCGLMSLAWIAGSAGFAAECFWPGAAFDALIAVFMAWLWLELRRRRRGRRRLIEALSDRARRLRAAMVAAMRERTRPCSGLRPVPGSR
jgi:hypothetical protein